MGNIQIFNHPQFGEIRTMGTPENPEFCAMDLCRALGYRNGRDAVAKHVDEWDVAKRDTPTKNQWGAEVVQQITYVNESGMYFLAPACHKQSSSSVGLPLRFFPPYARPVPTL